MKAYITIIILLCVVLSASAHSLDELEAKAKIAKLGLAENSPVSLENAFHIIEHHSTRIFIKYPDIEKQLFVLMVIDERGVVEIKKLHIKFSPRYKAAGCDFFRCFSKATCSHGSVGF